MLLYCGWPWWFDHLPKPYLYARFVADSVNIGRAWERRPFCCCLLILTVLKGIIDRHGHAVGDTLITENSWTGLTLVFRKFRYRWTLGWGWVLVVLNKTTPAEVCQIVADKILRWIGAVFIIDVLHFKSLLVLELRFAIQKMVKRPLELVQSGDTARYKAKHNGRGKVGFCHSW